MKLTLTCPHAVYGEGMKINCKKTGNRCGNQRFKPCKGWWVLTPAADKCPVREGGETDGKTKRKGAGNGVSDP